MKNDKKPKNTKIVYYRLYLKRDKDKIKDVYTINEDLAKEFCEKHPEYGYELKEKGEKK